MNRSPSYSRRPAEEKESTCGSTVASRAETVVYASLGLAGLVTIGLAILSASLPAPNWEHTFTDVRNSPVARYLKSGQLAADMRTAVALVHYVFESQPAMGMDQVDPALAGKKARPPLNILAAEPKT